MATKRIYYFTAGQFATAAENTAIAALQAQVFAKFTTTTMRADVPQSLPVRACDYVCGTSIPAAYAGVPVIDPANPPAVTSAKTVIFFVAGIVPTAGEVVQSALFATLAIPDYELRIKNYSTALENPVRVPDFVSGSVPAAYTALSIPVFSGGVAAPTVATAAALVGTLTQGTALNITAATFAGTIVSTARKVYRINSDSTLTQVFAGTTSQTYTPVAADVPTKGLYVVDTATNTGGTATSTSATLLVNALKTSGVMRLIGTQNQQAAASALNGTFISAVMKVQAPGGAIGVRLGIVNNSAAYGMASAKFSVASTEISAIGTTTDAYTPSIGGTTFNVVSTTTTDKGFVKGKWGGNATSRRIYPSNSILPSFGYNNQEEMIISDILPLVPKRATDRTAEEYYYIFRIAVAGANGQDGMSQIEGGTGKVANVLFNEWISSSGADSPMMCIGGLGSSADAVDGSITTNMPGGIGNGWSPNVVFEWIYPAGVLPISFLHDGDSITEGYEWPRWAVNRRNTNPLRPLSHMNYGGSTTRTESYLGELYLHLQTFGLPTYMVMPIISVNNYSPLSSFTLANAQTEYTRLQAIATFLTGLGIKIIWWVPFNYGANPAAGDVTSAWGYIYNNAKTYAASNSIEWMDINGDSRLVRSVYNASTNPTGWIDPDNTHPSNPTGKAGFAQIYTEKLIALGY